jgi:serine/threonine protein phosphatase PrpC
MGNKPATQSKGAVNRRPSAPSEQARNNVANIPPRSAGVTFVTNDGGSAGDKSSESGITERSKRKSDVARPLQQVGVPKPLQRAKSALPPSTNFERTFNQVERSKSLPVYGHRRADVFLDDEAMQEILKLQSTLKEEKTVNEAIDEALIESFFKKCDSFVYGSQKLSGVPGQERPRTGVIPTNVSVSCIKGLKGTADSSPNQDNYSYCSFGGYEFYTLQDGHGPAGHMVSFRGVRSLPLFVTESRFFPNKIAEAIVEAYKRCNADLVALSVEKDFDIQVSGCACVMVIRKDCKLWVSHAGDSRVVLGNVKHSDVVGETRDHKPTDPAERTRLETSGSEIQTFSFENHVQISRIFVKGADYPGLCMSRSLGDQSVKEHGVIPIPEVSSFDIIPGQTFVVLASDGVWEFIPSKLVCSSLAKKLRIEGKDKCVARIVTEAKKRWKSHEGSYCDDITALLVCF